MLGTIIGLAGNAISNHQKNQAQQDQFYENKELMNYQAQLNKGQAYYSTGLAKSLWDYTNYENTMRHIKAAGLSPSLIYGGGGGGIGYHDQKKLMEKQHGYELENMDYQAPPLPLSPITTETVGVVKFANS